MKELQKVTKEQALKLIELGFDWPTVYCLTVSETLNHRMVSRQGGDSYVANIDKYENRTLLPEHALVFKWLRDVHGVDVTVFSSPMPDGVIRFGSYISRFGDAMPMKRLSLLDTYENSESEAITWIVDNPTKWKKDE